MGMQFNRRTVIGAAAGVVVVGAVAPMSAQALPATAKPTARTVQAATGNPRLPVRSEFAPHIGAVFPSSSPRGPYVLRLVAIDDVPGAAAGSDNAFSLVFDTQDTARDGIFHLTSPSGATHVLFLARVGGGSTLEALVDRTR